MKKIFFDTDNKLLFQTVKSMFEDIGFCEIVDKPDGDIPVLKEQGDSFTVGGFVFPKPFSVEDFTGKNIFENIFSFAGFKVNRNTRKITYDNNSAMLTQIELSILEILYNSDVGVSLDDILKDVLQYSSVSQSKTSATHIYNLRKKLNSISGLSNVIVFENDKYRLNVA